MKNRKLTVLLFMLLVLFILLIGVYWVQSENNNRGPSEHDTEQSESVTSQESSRTETEADSQKDSQEESEKESEQENIDDSQVETQTESEIENEDEKIGDFSMFFTGDVLLRNNTLTGYNREGLNGLISEYLEQEMVEADLTMVNEEFPFSTNGEPMPDKKYTFRTDPKYVKVFQEMGIDVVSLANNHALDYGKEALLDTFVTLDNAGIPYVGAGETKERAEEVIYIEADGRKIGVLSASRVIPVVGWNIENEQPGLFCTYSSGRLVQRIKEVEQECDFVVVYVHWGLEYKERPEEYQRKLAQEYIDAGADLVVGSHSHVPQGIEYYKNVPIVYCLGNFIFSPTLKNTYAIKVVFDTEGATSLQVIPIAGANAKTYELEGDKKQTFIDYLESISFGVEIDENGMVKDVSMY